MDIFFLAPLSLAVLLSLLSGPLGCVMIWRRMAYFGDTLSHASLMGISFSLALSLPIQLGIFCIGFLIAFIVLHLRKSRYFAMDTILSLIAHGGLAVGIIIFSLSEHSQLSLFSYLFGDILSTSFHDVILVGGCCLLAIYFLYYYWDQLLLMTIHKHLADSEGIPTKRIEYFFLFILTIIITFSIQIVGVLLITSLLIIPAAAARNLSHTPIQMAVIASILGMISSLGGFTLSFILDVPTGPAMIASALLLFLCSHFRVK